MRSWRRRTPRAPGGRHAEVAACEFGHTRVLGLVQSPPGQRVGDLAFFEERALGFDVVRLQLRLGRFGRRERAGVSRFIFAHRDQVQQERDACPVLWRCRVTPPGNRK
jgi:hypothetical protein